MGKHEVFKLASYWRILGEIISGISKQRDVIRIICGRLKSKFEFIANVEMRILLNRHRLFSPCRLGWRAQMLCSLNLLAGSRGKCRFFNSSRSPWVPFPKSSKLKPAVGTNATNSAGVEALIFCMMKWINTSQLLPNTWCWCCKIRNKNIRLLSKCYNVLNQADTVSNLW